MVPHLAIILPWVPYMALGALYGLGGLTAPYARVGSAEVANVKKRARDAAVQKIALYPEKLTASTGPQRTHS